MVLSVCLRGRILRLLLVLAEISHSQRALTLFKFILSRMIILFCFLPPQYTIHYQVLDIND